MGLLNIPASTNFTYYDQAGNYLFSNALLQDAVLDDGNGASDLQFTPNEPLLLTIGANPAISATYLGLADALLNPVPVLLLNTTPLQYVVLNRALDPTAYPDVASLSLDNTASFDVAPCFAAGTRIATPEGWTEVQYLAVDDLVLTADGRAIPVLWLGHRKVVQRFASTGPLALVRIRANALGPGLPMRDLVVTADHALALDGVMVQAGALIGCDGIETIPDADLGGSVTVWHIETEGHDLVLAEGVAAETYIDYAGRQAFDNHAEFAAMFPQDRRLTEMTQPRITSPRHLPPSLRRRLASRKLA